MGKATSNRIQSFFLRTSPTNDTALSDAREGLTPRDPLALLNNGPFQWPREPDPKVGTSESGELVFCLKTHGCPVNYKAFDGNKIILDNFMRLPVILLARAQMTIDNRLSY